MTEIQLRFGRASDGRMIEIGAVVRGLACDCFCPECEAPLVAVKGDVYRHHFRHYADPLICRHARETALHLYAKQIICEQLQLTLPHDLGPMKSAHAEVWLNGIIPDVLAEYEQETIAIEIWVAHQVPREKIEIYDMRRMAALEIDLRLYRSVNREDIVPAILHQAPRKWLLPPLAVRLEMERIEAERAAQAKHNLEVAMAAKKAAEAKRIAEEQKFQFQAQQAIAEIKARAGKQQQVDQQREFERQQEHEVWQRELAVTAAREQEANWQRELQRQQQRDLEARERARIMHIVEARRLQLESEKRGPDLQELVRAHGGYAKITPEAWAEWDDANTQWQEQQRQRITTSDTAALNEKFFADSPLEQSTKQQSCIVCGERAKFGYRNKDDGVMSYTCSAHVISRWWADARLH